MTLTETFPRTLSTSIRLLPRPTWVDVLPGCFTLGPETAIRSAPSAEPAARLTRELLAPSTGLPLAQESDGSISLDIDADRADLGSEGYELTVDAERVLLCAASLDGLRHGVQTVRQLLPPEVYSTERVRGITWSLPSVRMTDVPKLAWRGAMLDVARHFFPVTYLRRFVDLLAVHKANVLHLHLTDDQGWRMPVAAYPRLTEVGAYRSESAGDGVRHGGAYTRQELRDLVEYAAQRGITVVPEIEMPGHVRAALAAYPELGNQPERPLDVWTRWGVCENILGVHDDALRFCRSVLDETMQIFPSRYIHIGGDESPLTEWKHSASAASRIRDNNLGGTHDLYRWFMGQAADHVARAGRKALAWAEDELTLPPAVTVMPWRDISHGRAAVDRGHDIVMAPHRSTYLDYAESADPAEPRAQQEDGIVLSLRAAQEFSAVPDSWDAPAASRVLGVQGQLWTEYLPTPELLEYRAFPRFSALADAAWGGVDRWDAFEPRLDHHRRRLDVLGVPRTANRDDDRGEGR